jgi:hypothetical protein
MPTRVSLQLVLCALVLLVAGLSGCGPGIGGTGTGTATVPPPGASNVSLRPLCESDFADLLRCSGTPGSTAAALGSALSFVADSASARDALLRIEGNAADLELFCAGVQFSGSWGQVPGQAPRFHGVARSISGAEAQYASLSVVRTGAGVVVQLFSASSGQALTGPLTLQVVALPPPLVTTCR